MEQTSIGEITLPNGSKKMIFLHSGTFDFFSSPASNDKNPKHWEIKIDDITEISALDTLELRILSLQRNDETGKNFSFTAHATFLAPGMDLEEGGDRNLDIGTIEGVVHF